MVRAMCGVHVKDRNRAKNMMVPGLNEIIDQLAMAKRVHCNGQMLSREDGHAMTRALVLG